MTLKELHERFGQFVWTYCPTRESASYGNTAPVKPWRGKVSRLLTNSATVCYVSPDGIVDDDWNASATVGPGEVFDTEEECRAAWKIEVERYALALEQEARELRAQISS